jgi:hypothetical protein
VVAEQLSVESRANEDRVVQCCPLCGVERFDQVDQVRNDQHAAEQQRRDHDTQRKARDRDRGDGEDTESNASPSISAPVVEKVDRAARARR